MRVGNPENPTLVLLHGLGRSKQQWDPVVYEFSKNFDVFTFDLPGFGGTGDLEPSEIDISFPVLLMDQLFRKLGIERPILVGESFGGLLALVYAHQMQESISKLGLMGSAGLGHRITYKYRFATIPVLGEAIVLEDSRRPDRDGINFKDLRVLARLLFNTIRFSVFRNTKFGDPSQVLERSDYTNVRLLRYGVGLRGQKETINRLSYLESIEVPTLVMHGADDGIFSIKQATRAYGLFPNAWGDGPVVFKNGAHFPLENKDGTLNHENIAKFIRIVTKFGLDK